LGWKAAQEFVNRNQQLQSKPSGGRGRGKGRGRGGRGKKTAETSKGETEVAEGGTTKKRKIATPHNSGVGKTWTEDMEEEWKKWHAETWYHEWGENSSDWIGDWGHSDKAWDRYAFLSANESCHNIAEAETKERKQRKAVDKGEKAEDEQEKQKVVVEKRLRQKTIPTAKTTKTSETSGGKGVGGGDGSENPWVAPKTLKSMVAGIIDVMTETQEFEVHGPKDLTDDMKKQLRDACALPTPEECRLNVYWKRPATGIHLKSEKKDVATFAVDAGVGTFLHRLVASLKAAHYMVTRINLMMFGKNVIVAISVFRSLKQSHF